MEYQFSHKDEKGYGEKSEGSNGSKNSCYCPDKAWYSPEEEIRGNYIYNEKGKGDGQVGEKQEHHTPKEQTNDQPPFHDYFPVLISISLLHAILKNWMVRRMKPMGMMLKTADFGIVTALTSVTPCRIQSHIWTTPK
jgi:hypothetical protein